MTLFCVRNLHAPLPRILLKQIERAHCMGGVDDMEDLAREVETLLSGTVSYSLPQL
jgi:hypothetical protein